MVGEALKRLGLPAEDLITQAQSDDNKLNLRRQTEAAAALGIFGAPTFITGDEMFWGNDRLDEALAWARGASFAPQSHGSAT